MKTQERQKIKEMLEEQNKRIDNLLKINKEIENKVRNLIIPK